MINLRYIASCVIHDVTEGRSLSDALDNMLPSLKEPRDRAWVQAVCYGVCRFYMRLDVLLSHLLQKPMKAKDSDVHALLLVGLYQLTSMRTPEYAAVTETVNAITSLKKPHARGLVNAVLRNYLRKRVAQDEMIQSDEEARFAHPLWWIQAIRKAWPNDWEAILDANNQHPPFSLRINQQKITRAHYIDVLKEAGHHAEIISGTMAGIWLETPSQVESLPGFSEGQVTVQDASAQLAASLLQLKPNQSVLDACAAPGGKLTHLLEMEPTLSVVAVEKDASRMAMIKENIKRAGVDVECVCEDAGEMAAWWKRSLFDRILLDAPCSASGIVRRHPDIKLLRDAHDILVLACEQQRLLRALWPLLKPGGLLLYATCSIFPEENVEVVKTFLAGVPDAKEEVIQADWGVSATIGRQILTGQQGWDGFYYALFRKVS